MKHLYSVPNGSRWIKYAQRAAHYGAALRKMGLPPDHPERARARESYRRGVKEARRENWKHRAARHIIAALTISKKKALAAA